MPKHIDLQSLVDTHERPFAVIDREFTVIAVNRAYERAFEARRDELVGRKCHAVLHRRDRPCFEEGEECPYLQCYADGKPYRCLHTHYDQQGRTRWVRVNLYPLRGADGELYVGEMLQEIAARDDAEAGEDTRPVGVSPVFLQTLEQLEQAARSDAHVLLVGETGTGKEVAAKLVHRCSKRRDEPFIALDCTVVTESLFESEVFGHERGAFTGSVGARRGLFEVAGAGTLFLDEISEASPSMQAKLLRVLETGEFRRVGGNATLEARARIVCATNRNLLERVHSGEFREDLYYRIACFCVRIPPLRERMEDLPVLCEAILERLGRGSGQTYRMKGEAIDYLAGCSFPGNVRQLRNILQAAVTHGQRSGSVTITPALLARCLRLRDGIDPMEPPGLGGASPIRYWGGFAAAAGPGLPAAVPAPPQTTVGQASPTLRSVEASHIAGLLRHHAGNRRRVAAALGISERTLYRKLKRYNLGDVR
jgi:PAS domain S-box-containing protein